VKEFFKIGQYLTKLCVDYVGLLLWPTLYVDTIPQRHRETDRRTDDLPWQYRGLRLSRGKTAACPARFLKVVKNAFTRFSWSALQLHRYNTAALHARLERPKRCNA